MRSFRRGFRSFRRNYARNLIVIVLLFVCLTFSMSMLSVKLAADSQVQAVKETVGNYGEIKVSSSYQMKQFERTKTAAERAAAARSMTAAQELANRVSTLVPESLTDKFSKDEYIKTYDKVLEARVSLSDVKSSDVQQAFQFRDEQRGGPGGSSNSNANSFTFSGNTNGSSASDFTTGSKKLVQGKLFTYQDYTNSNPVVVIEKNLAETNDLAVGDTIEATVNGSTGKSSTMDLEIIGIYETVETTQQSQSGSNAATFNPAGSTFYAPVSVVQKLNGTPGYLSLGSYYYASAEDSGALRVTFKKDTAGMTSGKYQFATDKADYLAIADPLLKARNTAVIGLAGALGACALIILLAMIIIVGGRTRELGVLKAIGSKDSQVIGQFAFEVLCICLVAIIFAMGATAFIGQTMGNWLLPKTKATTSTTSQQGTAGGPGGAPGMNSSRLYKSGTGFNATSSTTKQAAKLNVVYRGSLFLYGIGILVLISLIGMAIPLIWIIRLRPARVLSME